MDKFIYKAWDENYNLTKDIIEAVDLNEATEKLQMKGLKIINIKKQLNILNIKLGNKLLKDEVVASFCGQVATVLNAGVSIINGLEVIKEQDKKMKNLISIILEGVSRGETLSRSMENTGVFQKLLIDMVRSGELSGNIDEILFNMEQYYQKEAVIKSKIKSSSVYPSILILMTFGMLGFFNFFIIPKMKDIFEGDQELPFITEMLLASNRYITNNILQIIILLFAAVFLILYAKKMPKVKYNIDKYMLKMPVWGEIKRQIITARFTRSMNIFLKSSVPLLEALDNIAAIVSNDYIGQKIDIAKKDIISGRGIAASLGELNIFDSLVIQMIKIGEETGKLEEMFIKLAEIYDKKTEASMQKMMSLMEPVFTLIIGVIVAIIVVAMALPILNMSNLVQ